MAGLAAPGSVGLNVVGNTLGFSVPDGVMRSNVSLSNGAEVNVRGAGTGDIVVTGRDITIAGGSIVRAGIDKNLGTSQTQGGDIQINATGAIVLTGNGSRISNVLDERAFGKAGNININAETFSINDDALVASSTFGKGDGGNIFVKVNSAVSLTGDSGIYSNVETGAEGKGGNITINADSFSLTDGAELSLSIFGQGNAGNVSIRANRSASFVNGDIFNNVEAGAEGKSGDINIQAGSLSLTNGTQLQTLIREAENNLPGGVGNGGNVKIDVSGAVTIAGVKDEIPSGIITSVGTGANGNAGNITINADSFSLTDGARLNLSTLGNGNAGNVSIRANGSASFVNSTIFNTLEAGAEGKGGDINIQAGSLSLTDGAQLQTLIRGAENNLPGGVGDGGNVKIDVSGAVTIAGVKNENFSGIVTSVETGAKGNGGNITINADSFSLTDGARLNLSTFGQGNAGNVSIQANNGSVSLINGNIYNTVEAGAEGNGGNINIKAASLSLTNNTEIRTSISQAQPKNNLPAGKGNGGNVNIDVSGKVTFANPSPGRFNGISTEVEEGATGNGGSVTIKAGSLEVTGGSEIQSSTRGKGNSGTITINARDSLSFDGSSNGENFSRAINAVQQGAEGNAGGIRITTGTLSLTNGAFLSSGTEGTGNAGDIIIEARDTINFDSGGYAQSNVFKEGKGKAGNIRVTTGSLSLTNGSQISANVSGNGVAGNIIIEARDLVKLNGMVGNAISGVNSSLLSTGEGKGGNIQITTGSLSVSNGAALSTNTNGQGDAGNITINARDTVTFEGFGGESALPSAAYSFVGSNATGNGGDIQVTTGSLSVINGALINASSLGQGNGGNVTIDARDAVTFEGGSNGNSSGIFSVVFPDAVGKGGNLRVTAKTLSMNNNAGVLSSTLGQGDAGNIFVQVSENISIANSSGIDAGVLSRGLGKGGTVDINTRNLTLTNGSGIGVGVYRAQQIGERLLPASRGQGGNIRINASDSVTLSGYDSKGFSSAIATLTERGASGDAGDITVTTGKFRATDGAGISAATFNEGKGGDITINANIFELINGGQVLTNTRSSGNAGNIYLNVKDRITITGSDPNFNQRIAQVEERLRTSGSTDQLTDVVTNQGAASGLFANTAPDSTGNGGNIIIDPRQMTVKDGGSISVNSEGTGNTGNISIQAGTLTLDNATITARAASRTGGNINLNLGDLLLLRNGSEISTTAGIAGAGGDGGNITINTPFIVAIPGENSDITANAFTGRGGNVNISTQGIFGIEFRSQQTSQSDITASSSFGISGVVDINSPDTDSMQNNLAEFSQNPIDTNNLIANSCVTRSNNQQGTFYITGSGGFPTRPSSLQISPYPIATAPSVSTSSQSSKPRQQRKISEPIVEAQGVYQLENGQLVLSRECP